MLTGQDEITRHELKYRAALLDEMMDRDGHVNGVPHVDQASIDPHPKINLLWVKEGAGGHVDSGW